MRRAFAAAFVACLAVVVAPSAGLGALADVHLYITTDLSGGTTGQTVNLHVGPQRGSTTALAVGDEIVVYAKRGETIIEVGKCVKEAVPKACKLPFNVLAPGTYDFYAEAVRPGTPDVVLGTSTTVTSVFTGQAIKPTTLTLKVDSTTITKVLDAAGTTTVAGATTVNNYPSVPGKHTPSDTLKATVTVNSPLPAGWSLGVYVPPEGSKPICFIEKGVSCDGDIPFPTGTDADLTITGQINVAGSASGDGQAYVMNVALVAWANP